MDAPQWNGDDDRDLGCDVNNPLTCQCPACRAWVLTLDDIDDEKEALRNRTGGVR